MIDRTLVVLLAAMLVVPAHASNLEGDYLYRVTTVRAAPGKFSALLDAMRPAAATTGDERSVSAPILMRHTQGDQWDLIVVTPMKSFCDHFGSGAENDGVFAGHADLVAFEADVFALGPDPAAVHAAYDEHGLFHIEMFEAVAGMSDRLVEQRRMENRYLAATGQVPNMIFRRVAGGDVDVFTIGFHESLETFAAPAPASDAEKEAAAKKAGFDDRADISFYLRSLISGHHDTFAVKVD